MVPEVTQLGGASDEGRDSFSLSLKLVLIPPHSRRKEIPKDKISGGQKHEQKDITSGTKGQVPDPSLAESWRIMVQSFCLDQEPVLPWQLSRGHTFDFDSLKNTVWV